MTLIPLAASVAFACFLAGAMVELRSASHARSIDALAPTRQRLLRGEISRFEYERIARMLMS